MADVQRHPRFAALVRDCGLAAYWRERGHRPDYLGDAALP